MRVLGAVLAGGASSRFGSDKALAMLGGLTLLDHAAAAIAPFVEAVVVIGRGEVNDLPRAGLGPLSGIAGALDHARRTGYASVLTIACDMPVVPAGLIEALLANAPSFCADAPVVGHWQTALAGALTRRLSQPAPSARPCAGVRGSTHPRSVFRAKPWMPGQAAQDEMGRSRDPTLSVRRWAIDIGAVAIPSPAPITNINTPADLPPP